MNFPKKMRWKYFVFPLTGVFLFSCTTKKNTVVTRTFHYITAKYNGYFNGNESFREGVAKIEKSWQDDYTGILPMYKYGDAAKAVGSFPEMDKAISKATTVIQRHEIVADPKAHKKKKKKTTGPSKPGKKKKTHDDLVYRQWIDDSYLLIGKSHFYKCEYPLATEMFEYVSKKYKKYPSRFDAMLWLIRTFIETKEYQKAQTIFDLLNDKKISRKMTGPQKNELSALEAHYHMKQNNYSLAVEPLIKATAHTGKKTTRTRFTFILAQIFEKMASNDKAMQYYSRVLKMSPDYEMSFQAQLKRARLADVNDKNRKELIRELQKMIRDEKNKDYLDQLYFALAEIMLKENDRAKALDYLKLAVGVSEKNVTIKGHAYLKIAEIYFGVPDYVNAKAYYDSTLTALPETYTDYHKISTRRNVLKDIVKYMNIIVTEDSLLRIAALSTREQEKIADKIIANIIAAEERKKQQEQMPVLMTGNMNMQNPNTGNTSQWYFYNPSTVSFGYSEFLKKWGNRKLEDHWRRSNKMSVTATESEPEEEVDGADGSPAPTAAELKNRNYYLKNIPSTSQLKEQSMSRLIDAWYNLGIIFKEQLQDNVQAIKTFEAMMAKYPDNKYQLPVYYQLYRLHYNMNNTEKSNYYRDIILSQYPGSEYARVIQDPEYLKSMQSESDKVKRYYEKVYAQYLGGDYGQVIEECRKADSLFLKNTLAPKFEYLMALAVGHIAPVTEFETALKTVLSKHPKDPVAVQAKEILDYIAAQKGKIDIRKDTVMKLYELNEMATHYYVFVGSRKIDMNKQKILFSNYNSVFFGTQNLKVESILLDTASFIITVREFANKEQAMVYYEAVKQSNTVLVQTNPDDYQHFVISSGNFPVFYGVKNTDQYLAFFTDKYLKK